MHIRYGGDGETRRSAKPIGLIGNDAATLALARTLAAAPGTRILLNAPIGAGPTDRAARIERAATASDIAADCDIVLSTIEDTAALRALLLGAPDRLGLGAEMAPGSVFVDLGVRPARDIQALLGQLGTRGVAVIDAAIIGDGVDAVVLAGGYPDAVDQAEPILSCIGLVERTGPLGSAHTAAALMSYLEAAQFVAEQEARSVGRALGLSDAVLARIADSGERAANVVHLARRADVIRRMAADRGVSADVIDYTRAKLSKVEGGN